jgi:DNA-binding NarL/FixJ family response regulator
MAKTILVADDNPTIRRILCRAFELEKDYDVCAEAANGQQAVQLAVQHCPDRGFSVRCKVCNEEAVYGVNQVQEFEGTPRARMHVSNHLRKTQRDPNLNANESAHI